MKYVLIRYWDDSNEEENLGEFDTRKEAHEALDKDWEEFGSRIFIREHVYYRIEDKK